MQSSLAATARRIHSLTDTKNAIPCMPNGLAKEQTCLYTARVMSSRCPDDATVQFDFECSHYVFHQHFHCSLASLQHVQVDANENTTNLLMFTCSQKLLCRGLFQTQLYIRNKKMSSQGRCCVLMCATCTWLRLGS